MPEVWKLVKTCRTWIGIAALAGFLSVAARSAGLMPSHCCAAAHGSCPVTLCKAAPPKAPSTVEYTAAIEVATLRPFSLDAMAGIRIPRQEGPVFPSHEFRRPMRN